MGRIFFSGGSSRSGTLFISPVQVDATLAANLPASPLNGQTHQISVAGDFESSALIDPVGFDFEIGDYIRWGSSTSKWYPILANPDVDDSVFGAAWDGDTINSPSRNALYDKFGLVQIEIDATQEGAGLLSTGALLSMVDSTFLSAAESLRGAAILLDSAITATAGDVGDLQSELDATQGGAGLSTDGTLIPFADTSFIDAAESLKAAAILLDSAITTTNGDVGDLQSELDATQGGAGLSTDGTLIPFADTSFIDAAESLKAAAILLDSAITTTNGDVGDLQSELDATQGGAGLSTDGTLIPFADTSFIDAAESLKAAAILLDSAITTTNGDVGDLQSELDATQSTAGFSTDGTLIPFSGTHFIDAATTIASAIAILDSEIYAQSRRSAQAI